MNRLSRPWMMNKSLASIHIQYSSRNPYVSINSFSSSPYVSVSPPSSSYSSSTHSDFRYKHQCTHIFNNRQFSTTSSTKSSSLADSSSSSCSSSSLDSYSSPVPSSSSSSTSSDSSSSSSNESHSNSHSNTDGSSSSSFWSSPSGRELYLSFLLLIQFSVITSLLRHYGFDFLGCVGPSMLPTLNLHGDLLLVDFSWKWRHKLLDLLFSKERSSSAGIYIPSVSSSSSSSSSPPVPDSVSGLYRGDIIVTANPYDPKQRVTKRIIGLPGDVICVRSKISPNLPALTALLTQARIEQGISETGELPDDVKEIINRLSKDEYVERFIQVPPRYLWIQGDNLENSSDSRAYGPVPIEKVLGKSVFKLWPLSEAGTLEKTLKYSRQPKEFPYEMKQFIENYQKQNPFSTKMKEIQ